MVVGLGEDALCFEHSDVLKQLDYILRVLVLVFANKVSIMIRSSTIWDD